MSTSALNPHIAAALAPFVAPAAAAAPIKRLPPAPRIQHPMRRRTDFSPVAAIVLMVADMPTPEIEGLQDIVAGLARKLADPREASRFAAVVERLCDVHIALEDCKPRDERAEREWNDLQRDMAADMVRRSA